MFPSLASSWQNRSGESSKVSDLIMWMLASIVESVDSFSNHVSVVHATSAGAERRHEPAMGELWVQLGLWLG